MKPIFLLGIVALLAAGCATPRPRPVPLTQADVISMTKAGMADEEITRQIDATYTVFILNAEDVARLRTEGVHDRVIDFMLDTKVRAAVAEERRRNYYDSPRWNVGFGFGHWHRW